MSKELKVGVLTVITGVILYFGLNFLKGKDMFSSDVKLYMKLKSVENLTTAIAVKYKGFDIGRVETIDWPEKEGGPFVVTVSLKGEYKINKNSAAVLSNIPLTGTTVNIIDDREKIKEISPNFQFVEGVSFFQDGDTIPTPDGLSFIDQIKNSVEPMKEKIDSLIGNFKNLTDSTNKEYLTKILANIAIMSQHLNEMAATNKSSVKATMVNLKNMTGNLSLLTEKFKPITENLHQMSDSLKKIKLGELTNQLTATVKSLNKTVSAFSDSTGTLGSLLYDKKLYNNLNEMTEDVSFLVADMQANPHRYLNINIIGKKPVESDIVRKAKPTKVKGGEEVTIDLKRSARVADLELYFYELVQKQKVKLTATQVSSTSIKVTLPSKIEKGEHAIEILWNKGKDNDYISIVKK